ncbi:hypothetical protein PQX77_015575 [Marasmius sp. AFHP31]|nr:hypothetical protein PQX77_015575 [Marasmius sp. AFHP31]
MNVFLRLLTFLSLVSLIQIHVMAQTREVTVNQNDTSQITYGGGAGPNGSLCKYENGQLVPGQPGCYNIHPQPPCTESAAISQQNTSFASWKFKGSALRITSLLSNDSPIFNVEIDGKIAEADGAQIGKDSRAFTCYTLFTVDGLDPKVEHTVNMTIKGLSPNGNTTSTRDPDIAIAGPFSLINYT